jgi:hypothetical protein
MAALSGLSRGHAAQEKPRVYTEPSAIRPNRTSLCRAKLNSLPIYLRSTNVPFLPYATGLAGIT